MCVCAVKRGRENERIDQKGETDCDRNGGRDGRVRQLTEGGETDHMEKKVTSP